MVGLGWFWKVLAGFGSFRLTAMVLAGVVVGGCEWIWLVLGGCGWLWVVVGGCGWFWLVPRFIMYDTSYANNTPTRPGVQQQVLTCIAHRTGNLDIMGMVYSRFIIRTVDFVRQAIKNLLLKDSMRIEKRVKIENVYGRTCSKHTSVS